MIFKNKAEMEFWKQIYLTIIACPNVSGEMALEEADDIVEELRDRIPETWPHEVDLTNMRTLVSKVSQ